MEPRWLLVTGILTALKPLFWIMLLLVLLLYMVGLVCTMALEPKHDTDIFALEVMTEYDVNLYFGSIPRSMWIGS